MIPKIIHYCWFGHGEMPALASKCIESWKKFFPDYKIVQWNEDNFNVNAIPYTKEAYEKKKYAFVSDYARFWVLYKYGGIYFDTDVEVLKDFTPILEKGPYMGCERDGVINKTDNEDSFCITVNPGLGMAAEPNMQFLEDMLNYYKKEHFIKKNREIDTETVVTKTTNMLRKNGLQNIAKVQDIAGFTIYPKVYFCPSKHERETYNYNKLTFSAHHYSASWRDKKFNERLKNPIWRIFLKLCAKGGRIMKRILGEDNWNRIRDKHLKRIYNFSRGIK